MRIRQTHGFFAVLRRCRRFSLSIVCSMMLLVHFVYGDALEVASPNRILTVRLEIDNGVPRYSIWRLGREVIRPSRLGFVFKRLPSLKDHLEIASQQRREVDETWEQPWGEKRFIRNHYRELAVDLAETRGDARTFSLQFRVYDDGVGFRYLIPAQAGIDTLEIMDELTEFVLTGDHKAWWIPAYQWNRYEYLYQETPASRIVAAHTPLTMETEEGLYLSFHEAALTDYASMTLARTAENRFEADLVPWSDGVRVKARAPMMSPWRTIQIVDTPGELITSYLILNLNEPSQIKDVSWIKPGKYVGIWWEMHLGLATWGSGETHGATTANAQKYIDFAAKYGFDGVLIEGWNVGWDGDWIQNGELFRFSEPYPDFDMEQAAGYAKQKGVRLIGHHETATGISNYERQLEDAFAYARRHGIRAVKTGYVGHGQEIRRYDAQGRVAGREWHHGQFMVRHYRKVVEAAAKHGIMLDVHEPIKPTGIRRTWPNMMTREGARGQEYNAWSGDGGNPPEHTVILPFTRLLAGPMDFTPGIFDLLLEDADRPGNRVNTTLAKQLALYVTIYSPLQMAADLPENYQARREAFQFIIDVPADWEDTRVLNARIGDYLTIARQKRGSEEWFLGSITDEVGRVLKTPLSFLPPGQPYRAQIYRDGEDADWKSNPYSIVIEEKVVDAGTVLNLKLAPGGGAAIRFIPQ